MVGEVIRRIDGRPIGQFLREEICEPLGGIDLFLGVPDAELARIAVLTDAPPAPAEYDARMVGEPAGSKVAEVFNRREVQQAAIPGSGGIMSARGLARHYAMLANGGELDGVRVLSSKRSSAASNCRPSSGTRSTASACGARSATVAVPTAARTPAPSAFGHVGGGGSFGYADPDAQVRHRLRQELLHLRHPHQLDQHPAALARQ